jgi:hypothetical protein
MYRRIVLKKNRDIKRRSEDNKYHEGAQYSFKHNTDKRGNAHVSVTLKRFHVTIFPVVKQ